MRMFAEMNEKLTGRNAQARKMANNTYLERREGGNLALRLHQTDVLTWIPDGSVAKQNNGKKGKDNETDN